MKAILAVLICTLLLGCGGGEPKGAPAFTKVICIEGVSYYHGGRMLAPAYNTDGTIKLCGG